MDISNSPDRSSSILAKRDQAKLEELFSEKIEKKDTIYFSFFFFIKKEFGINIGVGKEEEYFEVMDKYILERLDILKYLKNLDIMDRFRWILLNKEQSLALNFIKPTNIADEIEYDLLIKHQDKGKICYQIFNYFSNKIKNNEMTDIDEKIFSVIDPEIKSFWTS